MKENALKKKGYWCSSFALPMFLAVMLVASSGLLSAQKSSGLDFAADPHFGSVTLSAGFSNDPHTIRVVSGGSVNVGSLGLCGDCTGYASSAPDVKLHWSGSTRDLRIFFEADDGSDATLIINTPNGTWLGNDDAYSGTLNPMIVIAGAHGAGRYDIWVGSYSSGESISGTLTITEYNTQPGTTGGGSQGGSLDTSADPHFGSVRLAAGFTPDPHEVRIVSGGSVDVSGLGLCSSCTGFASTAPDFKLYWSGNTDDLRVYFEADERGDDATLIINTPDGTWIGNDDAFDGTVNPMLLLRGYGPGQYDIWVGSYSSGDNISGKLVITEHNRSPR